MNGFLALSPSGILGPGVVGEGRKVEGVVYDSLARNLLISYADGETEYLDEEVRVDFNAVLLSNRHILIGHFANAKFDQAPTDEYHVPLRQ